MLLRSIIEQIAAATPMTEVAVIRVKNLLGKVAKEGAASMRRLIIDVAGKAAAELLKGG